MSPSSVSPVAAERYRRRPAMQARRCRGGDGQSPAERVRLHVNVWTPGLRDGAKRAVMVWFHGGDFSSLSGSRNVIGTTATEMTMLIGMSDAATFTLDEDGLRGRLVAWMKPEDADRLIAVFHAGRPEASPSDLFFAIATAISFRAGAWTQAGLRAAQNAASVYLYELDWRTLRARLADAGGWRQMAQPAFARSRAGVRQCREISLHGWHWSGSATRRRPNEQRLDRLCPHRRSCDAGAGLARLAN
jgi:carboxylesterase type B